MSRRALLVGINQYHPLIGPLGGCLNDAVQVKRVLLEQFLLPGQDIRELYNANATRQAILHELGCLVGEAQAGDVLVVFYSGHGTRLPDPHDPSGKDEALVAFSSEWEALLEGKKDASILFLEQNWDLQFIRDKEIKACLAPLVGGVNLTLVMDCCYSGDVNRDASVFPRFLDPPPSIQLAIKQAQQEYWQHEQDNTPEIGLEELKLSKEHVKHWLEKVFLGNRFDFISTQENNVLLAACSESETALERAFDGRREGVFTHYLVEALHEGKQAATYGSLMKTLGQKMRFVPQKPRLTCPTQYQDRAIFSSFCST